MVSWLRKLALAVFAMRGLGTVMTTFMPADGPIQNTDDWLSITLASFTVILALALIALSYWYEYRQALEPSVEPLANVNPNQRKGEVHDVF